MSFTEKIKDLNLTDKERQEAIRHWDTADSSAVRWLIEQTVRQWDELRRISEKVESNETRLELLEM